VPYYVKFCLTYYTQLLHRFTQPGSPTEVKEIENRLRELQLSPQGWEIGDFLLGHQNPIFRFFGAVTFRVKLGTSSHELDDDTLSQITHRLLGWLVTSIARNDSPSVLRKLCSTFAFMVTLDKHTTSGSKDATVRRVILSVAKGEAMDLRVEELIDPSAVLGNLSDGQMRGLLWFLTAFIEEVNKENAIMDAAYVSSSAYIDLQLKPLTRQATILTNRVEHNVNDAMILLSYCFSPAKLLADSTNNYELQLEAASTAVVSRHGPFISSYQRSS
jgi:hypothetical protein